MKALVTNATEDAGIAAARSLKAAGYEVIGVGTIRPLRALRSRFLDAYHCLCAGNATRPDQVLVDLITEVRPDVLLPLGSLAVAVASYYRQRLPGNTAVNVVDQDAFLCAYDKLRCIGECRRLRISTPKLYEPSDARAVLVRERGRVSLVVKPRWDVGAAQGMSLVRTPEALDAAIDDCAAHYGGCIIQEFIPGGPEAMKTIVLLFTSQTRLAAAFTTQKVRHWPMSGGSTAISRSTADPWLVNLMLPFFEEQRWCGPAEVEIKFDARDNRHKVIEINPRFPGYLRFPCRCGLDLPALTARVALGADASVCRPYPAYAVGATYVAPTLFARTVRHDARERGVAAALRSGWADARGAHVSLCDLLSDPLPVLARTFTPVVSPATRVIDLLDTLGQRRPTSTGVACAL